MALNDAALSVAANAIEGAITHFQLHSGARGSGGTTNAVGSRVAVNGTVDADGDITWTNVSFTDLPADSPVLEVSYWSAATGGTYYGGAAIPDTGDNDRVANAAGDYTLTSVTEAGQTIS